VAAAGVEYSGIEAVNDGLVAIPSTGSASDARLLPVIRPVRLTSNLSQPDAPIRFSRSWENSTPRDLRYEARAYTYSMSLDYRNAWGVKGAILSLSRRYRKIVKDRGNAFRDKTDNTVHVFPYYTRFHSEYYEKIVKKLKRLQYDRAVFLTLTINPRNFVSLRDAYTSLQKGWNKLLTRWRKLYPNLKFVKVVEFQKNGSPHLHVLFLGISRLEDADTIREFWDEKYGEGVFIHVKSIRNDARQVISYLCKYFVKYLTPEADGGAGAVDEARGEEQLALAWALFLRAYSTSRGILDSPVKTSQTLESRWQYLGSWDMALIEKFDGKSYVAFENALVLGYLSGGGGG
jgi:hypothetical protein